MAIAATRMWPSANRRISSQAAENHCGMWDHNVSARTTLRADGWLLTAKPWNEDGFLQLSFCRSAIGYSLRLDSKPVLLASYGLAAAMFVAVVVLLSGT